MATWALTSPAAATAACRRGPRHAAAWRTDRPTASAAERVPAPRPPARTRRLAQPSPSPFSRGMHVDSLRMAGPASLAQSAHHNERDRMSMRRRGHWRQRAGLKKQAVRPLFLFLEGLLHPQRQKKNIPAATRPSGRGQSPWRATTPATCHGRRRRWLPRPTPGHTQAAKTRSPVFILGPQRPTPPPPLPDDPTTRPAAARGRRARAVADPTSAGVNTAAL